MKFCLSFLFTAFYLLFLPSGILLFAQGTINNVTELSYSPPDDWFIYGVIIAVVILGSIFAIFSIRHALSYTEWSLKDALSETVELTDMINRDGEKEPRLDANGIPLMRTELRASSSRVIAMMGMTVLLMMFIGFGVFAMYYFAVTGRIPDSIDKIVSFLYAGLTLFAPYLVNKFSGVFKVLFSKKR